MASIVTRAFNLANRIFPKSKGPKGFGVTFPLSSATGNTYTYILEHAQLAGAGIEWVTGCFLDNSKNSYGTTLLCVETGQQIFIAPYAQGLMPLLGIQGGDKVTFTASSPGTTVDINVIFLNFEGQGIVYSSVAAGTVVGVVTVNGTVTVNPATSPWTDVSANTSAAAATGTQAIMGVNGARKNMLVYNFSSNAVSIWINFTGNAVPGAYGSIEITPGGYYVTNGLTVSGEAVNLGCTAVGVPFTAKYQ